MTNRPRGGRAARRGLDSEALRLPPSASTSARERQENDHVAWACGALGHTIASTQIRKDLCALGPLGRRGQGYAIDPLVEQLGWVLGLEHDWRIAIVGFGYLGRAFAGFITAREMRFKVAAIFDRSPAVVGQSWQGIVVQNVAEMERMLPQMDCNIAVISVPAQAAQESAQRVADLGIRAILNFAPMPLDLRGPVFVRNIDLAGEMAILTHRLSLERG